MRRIQCDCQKTFDRRTVYPPDKRKRNRKCRKANALCSRVGCDNGNEFYANAVAVLLSLAFLCLMLSVPVSASAWLSETQSIPSWDRIHNKCSRRQIQRLYTIPRPPKVPESGKSADNEIKTNELQFEDDLNSSSDDLESLRAQAEKLRREAESLQSALQESKEAKLQREIDKVDGWIDDLLIEVTLGDGTELLKTVDQVYDVLKERRYSAHHVLKIFDRLCDVREQESRSNCSPLMELLVDATGKLDCTERENNPNKRWNHRVERVLRRKLFARDWNIEYFSEDEKFW